jgi:phytoene/squalene synthetase
MKADLEVNDYKTKDEINGYINGSADVVGLMCLKPKLSDSKNGPSLKAFESIAQSTKKLYAIHKSLHLKDELQQFLSRGIPK